MSRRKRRDLDSGLEKLEREFAPPESIGFDIDALDDIDPAEAEAAYRWLVTPPTAKPES